MTLPHVLSLILALSVEISVSVVLRKFYSCSALFDTLICLASLKADYAFRFHFVEACLFEVLLYGKN